uniref:Uncharacterized protein n=1 Tax=Aegilops tauschii TaxID=37682 RepID=M8C3D6_AEGTA
MAHHAPSNALILLLVLASIQAGRGATSRSSPAEYVPVRAVVYRSVAPPGAAVAAAGDEVPGGGSYEPFQLCMGCRELAAVVFDSFCLLFCGNENFGVDSLQSIAR